MAAFVQSAKAGALTSSVSTLTVTLISNSTIHNCLVAAVMHSSGSATLSAPAGWTSQVTVQQSRSLAIFTYMDNPGGIGSVTFGASSSSGMSAIVVEFSGVATTAILDVIASNYSAGSVTMDSGTTATTAQANEVWFAAMGNGASTVKTISGTTNGFTADLYSEATSAGGTAVRLFDFYKLASVAAAANVATTLSSSANWVGAIVCLKDAASGPVTATALSVGGDGGPALGAISVAAPNAGTSPYQLAVVADTPYSYWRMNQLAGTALLDLSGNNRVATLSSTGISYNVVGALTDGDTALTFDGVAGDAISTIDTSSWTHLSVECWVNQPTGGQAFSNYTVCTKYTTTAGWGVGFNASLGSMYFQLGIGTGTNYFGPSDTFTANKWYHIVVTYDGANVKVYINAVLKTTTAQTGALQAGDAGVWIATAADQGSFFKGSIDEVAIYNTALTATRVTAHYTAGVSVFGVATLGGLGGMLGQGATRASVGTGGDGGTQSGAQYVSTTNQGGLGGSTTGATLTSAGLLGGLGGARANAQYGGLSALGGVGGVLSGAQFASLSTLGGVGGVQSGATLASAALLGGLGGVRASAYYGGLSVLGGAGGLLGGATFASVGSLGGVGGIVALLSVLGINVITVATGGDGGITSNAALQSAGNLGGVGGLLSSAQLAGVASLGGLGGTLSTAQFGSASALGGVGGMRTQAATTASATVGGAGGSATTAQLVSLAFLGGLGGIVITPAVLGINVITVALGGFGGNVTSGQYSSATNTGGGGGLLSNAQLMGLSAFGGAGGIFSASTIVLGINALIVALGGDGGVIGSGQLVSVGSTGAAAAGGAGGSVVLAQLVNASTFGGSGGLLSAAQFGGSSLFGGIGGSLGSARFVSASTLGGRGGVTSQAQMSATTALGGRGGVVTVAILTGASVLGGHGGTGIQAQMSAASVLGGAGGITSSGRFNALIALGGAGGIISSGRFNALIALGGAGGLSTQAQMSAASALGGAGGATAQAISIVVATLAALGGGGGVVTQAQMSATGLLGGAGGATAQALLQMIATASAVGGAGGVAAQALLDAIATLGGAGGVVGGNGSIVVIPIIVPPIINGGTIITTQNALGLLGMASSASRIAAVNGEMPVIILHNDGATIIATMIGDSSIRSEEDA